MKLIAVTCFLLVLLNGFSQKDKAKILAQFDYIEYYPDSTIRAAHQFIGATLERLTVEFNLAGMPVAMGKFIKGKRSGEWIYSDGSITVFPELKQDLNPSVIAIDVSPESNRTGNLRPGCGTGVFQARKEFQEKYEQLINQEKKK